mgnify:CR=1 FL=1
MTANDVAMLTPMFACKRVFPRRTDLFVVRSWQTHCVGRVRCPISDRDDEVLHAIAGWFFDERDGQALGDGTA